MKATRILRIILEADGKPSSLCNKIDEDGFTPLMIAAAAQGDQSSWVVCISETVILGYN